MEIVKVVEKSDNQKTGLVSATYAPIQSCPKTCPFINGGCYGQQSFCRMYSRKLNENAEVSKITQPRQIARKEVKAIKEKLSGKYPLRLHVVGDCRTEAAALELAKMARRYPNKVWTYTHAWKDISVESWGKISVLASCETTKECEVAYDLGYTPSIVIKESFEGVKYINGLYYMVCPKETKGMQCTKCKMCMNADRLYNAGIVICFPAHGSQVNITKSKVEDIK